MTDNLIETAFINKEIENLGESVTVRTVTKSSYSKWGDSTLSTSDASSIKCFVNIMTQEDDEVKEGIFKVGDIRFFFKGNQTINRGDRIYFNSSWYEVGDVVQSVHVGTTLLKDVRVQKI